MTAHARTAIAGRYGRGSIVIVASVAYFAFVFQVPQGIPCETGLGDWIDPYFINVLLEHWYHSVANLTDPSSPPMYHPVPGTLGYSHGLILYAPFYIAVRPFLHPFQAYSLAVFLVMETGTVALYAILRMFVRLGFLEALLLTALFSTSANVTNEAAGIWSQRASVFLMPPILLTGLVSLRMSAGRPATSMASLSGFLAALMLTQDVYTGLFALLLSTLLLAGTLLVARDPVVRESVRAFRQRHEARVVASAMGGFAGVLMFLWFYLGTYREGRSFPPDQLWGSLRRIDPSSRSLWDLLALEAYGTVRSFTLVFVVGALSWLPWSGVTRQARRAVAWFLVVSVVVLLIPLRTADSAIWTTFFAPLPGFSVIRDPARIIYVYELMAALALGLFLAQLPRASTLRMTTVVLLLVLLVTDWNRQVFAFARPNRTFDRWVTTPIDIHPSCRSFFITGASDHYMSRSGHMWTLYGVDAVFIALDHSIPTLNGYTAWEAPGWDLANPQEADYISRVQRWIERHHLRDVCALDIDARTMTPYVGPPSGELKDEGR